MNSQHKNQLRVNVLVWSFFIIPLLCSSFLVACGSGGVSPSPQDAPAPYKPFVAWHVCLDNTQSYPVQFQHEALQNIADRIDQYISPNMGGMFVDASLIETNSLQDTLASFSTQSIPAIPPKPQAGPDPYKFASALRDWKKTVAKVNSLVASVRASIQPSLDTMRSFHKAEVGGTDIFGCADSSASEFAHFPNAVKILTYISDMQNNINVQFSKHINLYGAAVRVIFRPCQVQSVCEQNDAFWTKQFQAWGASSVKFFSPAESEAEHITGF